MRSLAFLLLIAAAAAAEGPQSLAEATSLLEHAFAANSLEDVRKTLAAIPALHAKETDAAVRKSAVEAVGKAAKEEDLSVRHGAFAALGEMKEKGSSKYLGRWLSPPKRFKGEIPPSYAEAIRAAGKIADPNTLEPLLDLADHNDTPIAEVATTALGGFTTLPTKRRKALAFELVDRLEQLSAQSRRKASPELYERKARLAAATGAALRALTGKEHQTIEGWRLWKENAEKEANPFGP
jgi:HEAT repeat protein